MRQMPTTAGWRKGNASYGDDYAIWRDQQLLSCHIGTALMDRIAYAAPGLPPRHGWLV
jgi:hypothetical protein